MSFEECKDDNYMCFYKDPVLRNQGIENQNDSLQHIKKLFT